MLSPFAIADNKNAEAKKKKITKKGGKQRALTRIQDHGCYVKLTSAKVSFVLNGNVPDKVKKKDNRRRFYSYGLVFVVNTVVVLQCCRQKKKKEHTRVYTYKDTQSIYGNPKKTRILVLKEQFNAR